jgi:4-hydroxy-tetrahydrodipicolinate synthase
VKENIMFFGSIPALLTPFSKMRIDEGRLSELVEWQIGKGSNALVPCGTTGESATLSAAEQKRVIEITVEAAAGRVPVIAGCGSNDVAAAIEHLNAAAEVGADAALIVTGYYNKPSQAGLLAAYRAFAKRPIFRSSSTTSRRAPWSKSRSRLSPRWPSYPTSSR